MNVDRGFVNVLILSFGFMLVFAAFQTMGNIEQTVLKSIDNFKGDGYMSLAIIYAVFATCNWLAPSYISVTGPRTAILTGSCCYLLFIVSFAWPSMELLYSASAVLGVGAAFMWTGHGQYLTENSERETMSRNAGVFWAIFQTSLFAGNLFVFFVFTEETIDAAQRDLVVKVLTILAVIGSGVLLFMRKPPQRLCLGEAEGVSSADKELRIPEPAREKPLRAAWNALASAFSLFMTNQMILLSLTFIYTGLSLTFFSGVYSSSIGFTRAMGKNSKSLIGLSGIFLGIGEVIGGAVFGILGSKCGRFSGYLVVLTGAVIHLFSFLVAFLNLPNDAPFKDTTNVGFISPSPVLAMAGSLTLGFGDACFNTQVYSLLGVLHAEDSAPAFALFKFCQSVAAAVSFLYSSHIGLYFQLLILLISLVFGTMSFCLVDIKVRRDRDDIIPAVEEEDDGSKRNSNCSISSS